MLKKTKRGGERRRCGLMGLAGVCVLLAVGGGCGKKPPAPVSGGSSREIFDDDPAAVKAMLSRLTPEEKALRERQMEQVKAFSAAKEKQSEKLASDAGEKLSDEARTFFSAGKNGDNATVRAMFRDFAKRQHQYAGSSNDKKLDTSYWSPMLEVDLAYETVVQLDPKSVQYFVDDTITSIPPGSIYFGGTDSGRGLITTFTKSHADADPFFTLTQNALADPAYLAYLRAMYGKKIYISTADDSAKCFQDYLADAQKRMEHDQNHPDEPRQIQPGEDVHMTADNRVTVSGQVAVMSINGFLAKNIFDHNPDKEFYLEESFPLDWMYPHLEPHGVIMKINREKIDALSPTTLANDRNYWRARVAGLLGDWLSEDTSAQSVADFADKVYVRKDLSGFTGDKNFIESSDARKMFSKLRSSIAGVYEWRFKHASSSAEKDAMLKDADYAFRQAYALSPESPDAVLRYVNLLMAVNRIDDATLLVSTSCKLDPKNEQMASLLTQLKKIPKK